MRFWQRWMQGKSYDSSFAANRGLTPAGVGFGRVTPCTPGVHRACRRGGAVERVNRADVAQRGGASCRFGAGWFASAANDGSEPRVTDAARCMSGRNLSKWVIR